MTKLLIRVIAISVPFLICLGGYEVQYRQRCSNAYAAKRFLLERRLPAIQILVLGPSYSDDGILPEQLGWPAFNLAMPAQSLFYDRALLEKYVDRMPELKAVIVPVSYATLASQLDDGGETWRCYYYSHEYGLLPRSWRGTIDVRNLSAFFLDERSPLAILLGQRRDFTIDYDPSGGFTNRSDRNPVVLNPEARDRLRHSALSSLEQQRRFMSTEHLSENVRVLHEISDMLRQRRIRPVFVSLPQHSYYLDGRDPKMCLLERKALAKISSEKDVAYFDFARDRRFNDSDFREASHLNYAGALKFTRILRDEVLRNCASLARSN